MKRALYSTVKEGTLVTVNSIYNKDRICRVVYKDGAHVVLQTMDGDRFYGPRSLGSRIMVWNLKHVEFAKNDDVPEDVVNMGFISMYG